MIRAVDRFERTLAPLRRQVVDHPLYGKLDTLERLRRFTESHVFAVWDFMSLLTALQQRLTCTLLPWTPSLFPPAVVRFVNEIKLGEESDRDGPDYTSHFTWYLRGMRELGADPGPMRRTIAYVRAGRPVEAALLEAGAPPGAKLFVQRTFDTIDGGSLPALAGAFTAGRELLIPEMFTRLLAREGVDAPTFVRYLERHVEVDGDEHGPLTRQLLDAVCGPDPRSWHEAEEGARRALVARHGLWDSLLTAPAWAQGPRSGARVP